MARQLYRQPTLTINEQLSLLSTRGLQISDQKKASQQLQNISMFRLKGYLYPMEENHSTHQFKPGASLEHVLMLYHFDSELRNLVSYLLAKIEVSIRTTISQHLSENEGPFWYTDSSNFISSVNHSNLLSRLNQEVSRSDDDQIVSFRSSYSNPWPPCWMTVEVSSFGNISMMYKLLRLTNERRSIAACYGLSDTVMESWIHSLAYVRNICAHHSRLWNRTLRISPNIPRHPRRPFILMQTNNHRIYFVLCIIKYMLDVIEPNHDMITQLRWLFVDYPQIDKHAMGFPDNWELEPIWR